MGMMGMKNRGFVVCLAALLPMACGGSTRDHAQGSGGTSGSGGQAAGGSAGEGGAAGGSAAGGSAAGGSSSGGAGAEGPCWPTQETCYASGPSGPGSACLATHDNSQAPVWQARLSELDVIRPDAFATRLVEDTILDTALDRPDCFQYGKGNFNWLFQIDTRTGLLKTGGGKPVVGTESGSCFAHMPAAVLPIAPAEVSVQIDPAVNQFMATNIDVVIPVFMDPVDFSRAFLIPLRAITLQGAWRSDEHNCVGQYDGDNLSADNLCLPEQPAGTAWVTGGAIRGHIRIDEAALVRIEDLGTTLCILLAGNDYADTAQQCRDASGLRPEGDWCSATNSAGGCADAFRFEAEFAASGFFVTGDCQL